MARLIRAATDRNPPTLGGGGCQLTAQSELALAGLLAAGLLR